MESVHKTCMNVLQRWTRHIWQNERFARWNGCAWMTLLIKMVHIISYQCKHYAVSYFSAGSGRCKLCPKSLGHSEKMTSDSEAPKLELLNYKQIYRLNCCYQYYAWSVRPRNNKIPTNPSIFTVVYYFWPELHTVGRTMSLNAKLKPLIFRRVNTKLWPATIITLHTWSI